MLLFSLSFFTVSDAFIDFDGARRCNAGSRD